MSAFQPGLAPTPARLWSGALSLLYWVPRLHAATQACSCFRYAENECNYCPRCQTGGRLLADRSLSRLLRTDWPRTLDEWEQSRASYSGHIAASPGG
jgi:hypothetical protein